MDVDTSDAQVPSLLSEELSGSTLEALKEFLLDRKKAESVADPFAENWGMSQFWYDSETAATVAAEVLTLTDNGVLPSVCIACPSLFRELKRQNPSANVHLLEYDNRFSAFGSDFTFYDYNHPTRLPESLSHAFHVIIADPPYLSEECLAKTATTIELLAKAPGKSPCLLLTGSVQRSRAHKYLQMRVCKFRPQHKNKLGNEFSLFTNYDPQDRLGGWEEVADEVEQYSAYDLEAQSIN